MCDDRIAHSPPRSPAMRAAIERPPEKFARDRNTNVPRAARSGCSWRQSFRSLMMEVFWGDNKTCGLLV